MDEPRRIRLSDQVSLSPGEHEEARRICSSIRGLVERRSDYVTQHRLDPQIADPGANWAKDADNAIHQLYQLVVRGEMEVLNKLRLYTQPFTGYQLAALSMRPTEQTSSYLSQDFEAGLEKLLATPDDWVGRYRVATRFIPKKMAVSYPWRFGEIGWQIDGRVANHDIYSYQERINLMFESGILECLGQRIARGGRVQVLEIGGGYGGLAFGLASLFERGVNYIICDLPESLLFSALYLHLTLPEHRHTIFDGQLPLDLSEQPGCHFVYVPNYMLDEVLTHVTAVDLAINTLSLVEMTPSQVRYYCERVQRLIGRQGMFFEQNHDGRWINFLDTKPILAEYFPHQTKILARTIPVLTKGQADIWSNEPLDQIVPPSAKPFAPWRHGLLLFFWRLSWLLRKPAWGLSKIREYLQKSVSPPMFARLRLFWNRMGGNLPS